MIFFVFLVQSVWAWTGNQEDTIGKYFCLSYLGTFAIVLVVVVIYLESKGIFVTMIQFVTLGQYFKLIFLVKTDFDVSKSRFLQWLFEIFHPFGIFPKSSKNFIENSTEEAILALIISIICIVFIRLKRSSRCLIHVLSLVLIITAQDFTYFAILNIQYSVFFPSLLQDEMFVSGFALSLAYLISLLFFFSYFLLKLKNPSNLLVFYSEDFTKPQLYFKIFYANMIFFSVVLCLVPDSPTIYILGTGLDLILSNFYIVIYIVLFRPCRLPKLLFYLFYHFIRILIVLILLLYTYKEVSENTSNILSMFLLSLGLLAALLRSYLKEANFRAQTLPQSKYEIGKTKEVGPCENFHNLHMVSDNGHENDPEVRVNSVVELNESIVSQQANAVYRGRGPMNLNKITVKSYFP